jgi:hypothetical protein
MEYNTTQEKLHLPEYGRNVQKMAQFLFTIEDRDKRSRAAGELILIMANMFPASKESRDFKHKLWDHLAIITQFKLDIDYPVQITHPESLPKPRRPAYNNLDIAHRHYGKIVEDLIIEAIELEEGEEKRWLIQLIANHMKKQYIAWNKNTVNDDIIYKDLIKMSKNRLVIDTTMKIHINTNTIPNQQPASFAPHTNKHRHNNNNSGDHRKKSFKNNNNNNNRKSK